MTAWEDDGEQLGDGSSWESDSEVGSASSVDSEEIERLLIELDIVPWECDADSGLQQPALAKRRLSPPAATAAAVQPPAAVGQAAAAAVKTAAAAAAAPVEVIEILDSSSEDESQWRIAAPSTAQKR